MNFTKIRWTAVATLALAFGVEAVMPVGPAPVFRSEIRGTINPASLQYLKRSITEAEAASAEALIVELDTPGGLVSSVQQMAQAISESQVPVVVYVSPSGAGATSAGALLLLSSHLAVMSPGTHMGAAHPVDSGGKDIPGAMGEKVLSDTVKFAQGMAELRGRPADLAEKIVVKSQSFTAQEALANRLIEAMSGDLKTLLADLDGKTVKLGKSQTPKKLQTQGAEIRAVEMNTGEELLHWLSNPNIAALLTTIGMLLIFMEFKMPGIQVAGILGAVCLIVSFMAFQTLPIRTGGLLLIGVGLLGLMVEVFASTHGVLAAGGAIAFVLGLIWVVDPSQISMGVSPYIWAPAGIFLGMSTVALGWIAARVKRDSELARQSMGGSGPLGLLGYRGVVETAEVEPRDQETRGGLLIRGETWKYCSDELLSRGDSVEVTGVDGFVLKVKKERKSSHV